MLGFDATGRLALGQVPGGASVVYNQAVNIAASGSVLIRKSVGKFVRAGGAGSVSFRKAAGLTKRISGAGTVTVRKSVGKFIRAAGAGAVTIARPITRACSVLIAAVSSVTVARSVGKIVAAAGHGDISFVRQIAFTVRVSTIGSVIVNAVGLIIQSIRRPLYLRGRTGSFWKGRR